MKFEFKNSKRIKYFVLLFLCLNCIGICVFINLWQQASEDDGSAALESLRDSIKQFDTVPFIDTDMIDTQQTDNIDTSDLQENDMVDTADSADDTAGSQTDILESTLDFERLWAINSEICAWLEIDGTRIDYPVLQSKDNDKKYLTTAYDGTPYIGGALYTEATYNNNDFDDPVTVIYGHTMRSGNLFGTLQQTYSSEQSFTDCSTVTLYLPGEVREYTVFAAVPYSKVHLLHTYDFENEYWYNKFFKDVRKIREIGTNINDSAEPEFGDRVIIMSVCLNYDTTRRYLVMAVNNEDLANNSVESSENT